MNRSSASAVMVLQIEIDPEHEAAFNEWYEKEHLPEVCALPGIVAGRRFKIVDKPGGYLTIYELESAEAVESEAYLAWRATSQSTSEMARRFRSFSRLVAVRTSELSSVNAGTRG